MEALADLGEKAATQLERVLKGPGDIEVRRRVERLLGRLGGAPEATLRLLRAVEALERIGTAEAAGVIAALTKGDPGARLTGEARAALERLKRR